MIVNRIKQPPLYISAREIVKQLTTELKDVI